MEFDDLIGAGSEILDAVTKAVSNNDYSDLSNTIRSSVDAAAKSVNEAAKNAARNSEYMKNGGASGSGSNPFPRSEAQNKAANWQQEYSQRNAKNGRQNFSQSYKTTYKATRTSPVGGRSSAGNGAEVTQPYSCFVQRKVSLSAGQGSRIGGVLGAVFSGMGLSIAAIILLIKVLVGATFTGTIVATVIFAILMGLSIKLIINGNSEKKLASKYYEFGRILGNKEFFNISEFAARIGEKEKKLREELRKMMEKGYLPNARLDSSESTLMLTDSAYNQYQSAEAARKEREEAQKAKAKAEKKLYTGVSEEVAGIIKEGNEYIKRIREINDAIPDTEEMSDKLYRLENIMNRIFEQVGKDPSNAPALRKFMNYYLPTTTKLLNAYIDLGSQPDVENVARTKHEIDEALDTINDGFEKIFNDMFQNTAWDISSDISVMKTMMEQDGLTGDGMKEKVPAGSGDEENEGGLKWQTSSKN